MSDNFLVNEIANNSLRFGLLVLCVAILPLKSLCQIDTTHRSSIVRLESGIQVSSGVYHISGSDFRQQPFTWFISGTPTLYIKDFAIPFSVFYSNQGLGYQQPFNQLGMAPSWKWIRLHLGYSNVHFSDYTLAGRRFLGAGVELTPGKLRLGAVYGRFQEAIEQDSILRPTPGNFLSEFPNGAFERKGYSVKLGVGSEQSFFDVIIFQAKDDLESLSNPLSFETVRPEQNTALGLKYRLKLGRKLFWSADAAASLYTRDIQFPELQVADSTWFGRWVDRLEVRTSSQVLYAANSQLTYEGRVVNTGVRYRRISRDFKTMGAYYFLTDVEEYSYQLGLQLFKRKVNFRGSAGWQRDNLSASRTQTTNRFIGSAVLGWQIMKRLRADVVYTNFGVQQRNVLTGLLDSLRVDQVAGSIQLQTRYQFADQMRPQSVGISISQQSLAPRSRDIAFAVDTRSYQANGFYTYQIPVWRVGFAGNLHTLIQETAQIRTSATGGGISANYTDKDGQMSYQGGIQWYANRINRLRSGQTFALQGGGQYRVSQHFNAGLQLRYMTTKGGFSGAEEAFQETFAQLNLNYHF